MKWLILLVLLTTTASAENYFAVAIGGTSVHLYDGYDDFDGEWTKHNNSHELVGIEYRDIDTGVAVIRFENSYYDTSYMMTASQYYQYDYFEVVASIGVVTGYENRDACYMPFGTVCGTAALGIQLKTPYIKPRLTWYGSAFVLTATLEF